MCPETNIETNQFVKADIKPKRQCKATIGCTWLT